MIKIIDENSPQYIHYGSDKFDKEQFVPISNRGHWIKPIGGLWASPVDSKNNWYEWCKAEYDWYELCETECDKNNGGEFNFVFQTYMSKSFTFSLKPGSKIIYISNIVDLRLLHDMDCCTYLTNRPSLYENAIPVESIDFEKLLSLGYVGVEISLNSCTYWSMYGWDCDSIVVMDPNSIVV
jgi:hypothetical protein